MNISSTISRILRRSFARLIFGGVTVAAWQKKHFGQIAALCSLHLKALSSFAGKVNSQNLHTEGMS